VGDEIGFWEPTELMIQGRFEGWIGTKAARLSDGQFGVGVHALDRT
jgi:hypothetical protein